MNQNSKYLYVYYSQPIGTTFSGLMDGANEEDVQLKIKALHPAASAIRVTHADDNRPAEPVYYSDIKDKHVACYIYAYLDTATGGTSSGFICDCGIHPELRREMVQHYCPSARGIIIDEVSEEECTKAQYLKTKCMYDYRIGRQP